MRLPLITVILMIFAPTVWADQPPVTFDCELKRKCNLVFFEMEKQKECGNVQGKNKELIYLGKQPFWFGSDKFEFDDSFLYRTNEYTFAGTRKRTVTLGEASEYGDFIYRVTFFKYGENVTLVEASHQQTIGYHWVCKN